MSDYSELKRLAETATPGPWSYDGSYVCPARVEDGTTYVETWRSVADCAQSENTKFIAAANPAAVLALIAEADQWMRCTGLILATIPVSEVTAASMSVGESVSYFERLHAERDQLRAENEALRSKLSTVHFVCDRLPDQDGCRFIELENSQGESLGAEVGKWEIRPDGLAQLVVTLGDGDFVALERGYAELWNKARELQFECDKFAKDAERYRWLRQDDVEQYQIGTKCSEEKMDAAIDAAMAKEVES